MQAQVNYDETKIPDYTLPELLITKSGTKIEDKAKWVNERRQEILELFAEQVYGQVPKQEVEVRFSVESVQENALCGKAIQKQVRLIFSRGTLTHQVEMLIYLPKGGAKSIPVFLGLNFYGNQTVHTDPSIPISTTWTNNNTTFCIFNNQANHLSRGVRASRWPIERILERGYGLATIYYGDLDPDYDDGFQNGIHPLFYKEGQKGPKANEWGAIGVWAYGLSKALDYFESDKDIDHERTIVIGHSRLGKAALWAGAQDQRFAMVISNNSGCGGAALSRRAFGETVGAINQRFPHWFNKNFHQYNNQESDLPVDQHMLLALMAPRPIYVASAQGDEWADPRGEFLSLYHAGSVFQLFGESIFSSDESPIIDQPKMVGKFGYHIRSGSHDITKFDWERYMDFADVCLRGK